MIYIYRVTTQNYKKLPDNTYWYPKDDVLIQWMFVVSPRKHGPYQYMKRIYNEDFDKQIHIFKLRRLHKI